MAYGEDDPQSPNTGSFEGLGLTKKPKKKNPLLTGVLQMQTSMAQQKPGALSSMAYQQGALGTSETGPMQETPEMKMMKKKAAK